MKLAKLLQTLVIVLAFHNMISAQTAPDLENGFKHYGSYDGSQLDTVNLMNGNLILHAPLLTGYPQRGKFSLQDILSFNAKTWQVICIDQAFDTGTVTQCGWYLGADGVTLQRSVDLAMQRTIDVFFSGTGSSYSASGYSLTTVDGAIHQLFATATANGVNTEFETVDNTGYHVVLSGADSSGVRNTATVTDRQGNQYVVVFDAPANCGKLPYNPPLPNARIGGGYAAPMIDDTPRGDQFCPQFAFATQVTDSNGNVMNLSNPQSSQIVGIDTIGRTLPLESGITQTTDYTGCVSPIPIVNAWFMNYNAPDGTTRQMKLCFIAPQLATAFNQPGVAEVGAAPSLGPRSPATAGSGIGLQPVATVVLADGTKWAFTYDGYLDITSVSLPSGGSITYTWTTIGLASGCGGQTKVSRAVATRTLNDGQGHTSQWTYSWGTPVNGVINNVVTDPLSNDTAHIFTALDGPSGCAFYETSTQYYQGRQNSGHLLKQVDTSYYPAVNFLVDSQDNVFGNIVAKDITTTVYPSGKVSKIHREYDPGLGTGKPIFGNVVKEQEFDWGAGAPGALLRETDTVYQWQKNSAYLTAHLLDLPASVVVISPNSASNTRSGCPINASGVTASCMAETDYSYDEASYLTIPTPAINTQHVASPNGVRGNQTTASHWLNTSSSFVSSHTNWYDTGEVYQQIDPLGHTTTHSYDPFYVGAYATQTCSPSTGGVSHCVSGTYDFNTGVLISLTNENATAQASGNTPGDSPHTSNYTYDYMFRITSALMPPDPGNGGMQAQTSFNFSAPNAFPFNVQRTKSITASLTDSATSYFDGLGRGYKSQHVLPNGTSTVDTTFDAAGHPAIVSNPYFSTSDSTYGITTSLFDGLGRAYSVTKQDGSVSSVAYNVVTGAHDAVIGGNTVGDCTDTTDEAGKQRRTCTDALGRMVQVSEPNPGSSATDATGSVVINGSEQSSTQSGASGSAQVSIAGGENFTSVCARTLCHTLYDSGNVSITVNGYNKNVTYQQGSTVSTVAAALRDAFHGDTSSPVDASCTDQPCTNPVITLTARTLGVATDYALSCSSTTNGQSSDFTGPSFTFSPGCPAALAGGRDTITTPDTGSVTITVNGTNYSTSYGGGDTAATIAQRLAGVISAGTLASGSASGSTVSITTKTGGTSTNYSLAASSTWNNIGFTNPSFTTSTSGSVLTGGYDAGVLDNQPYVTLYQYDAAGNLLRVDQKGTAPNDSTQWRTRTFTYDSLSRLLTANNPESGTITYSYDADGNLLQKTSPAPNQTGTATQTVSYCYDELHRVTAKGYGAQSCPLATPVVTYAYDSGTNAKGKLTSLTDQAGTASYTYDILGRLVAETRTLTGANNAAISKNLSYEYNLDGSLKTLHYPSGAAVTYTLGAAGLTLSAIDSGNNINYVTGATYGPDSALTGFISGNSSSFAGITNAFSYNNRLQPVTMSANAPSQTVFSIGYDFHVGNGASGADNGNVFGITNYKDATRNQTFTYDALNRLISAQNAGTDCTVNVLGGNKKFWGNTYSYDAWGNLVNKTKIGTACAGENLSLTADAHNWIHATGGSDYLYDAAGNMTFNATPPTQNYTYDQENRLTGAAGYAYTYDGDGNRVRKSSSSSTGTLYWYMTPGIVGESDLSGNLTDEYFFFDGERAARKSTNGVFYYFSDHLKTASVITDASGNIKSESDFYPWGGELQFVANDSNHYKFTGKERDTETQLDYFGARYYSNGLGRWVSADWSPTPIPVPYADLTDPQTLNLYQFVGGNPASKADPDGHDTNGLDHEVKGFDQRMDKVDAFVVRALNHPAVQGFVEVLGFKLGGAAEEGAAAGAGEGAASGAAKGVEQGAASGAIKGTESAATPKEGIYEGPDATAPGKTYVGQSGNVPSRLAQHKASGRFPAGTKVSTTAVKGGKTAREVAEHNRIQELGGVKSKPGSQTSNTRNPIGEARQHLLKKDEK